MTRKPAEQFGTTTVRPPDFDDFWAAIMAEANAIPPGARFDPYTGKPLSNETVSAGESSNT